MAKKTNSDKPQETSTETMTAKERRALLKRLGRFAAVTAPTVTLLLAAQGRPGVAVAASCKPASSKALKIAEGAVNVAGVLAGVAALPIRVWRGK